MIWEDIKLRNNLKKLINDVDDIIVFGSIVRGKNKPQDIDVVVVFKNKVNKNMEYKIRKELEKNYNNISIISKTKKYLLSNDFDAREGVLFEGISLLSGEMINNNYGFSSLGMFKYNFKGWDQLKKTKFYYALNGRADHKGILESLECIKLSDNLILAPLNKVESVKEFLDSWNIEYKYIPILLPKRLNRKNILE